MSKTKKILIITFVILTCVCIAGVLTVFFIVKDSKVVNDKLVKNYGNLQVFDINNSKLTPNSEYYVEYQNISPHIIDAFVNLEDKRFFNHNGLDYKRIMAATVKNFASFSFKEGASTISQQLIKNTHLTNQKTIKRKLIEARLAIMLEKQYSKEEILEMYLNAIYFGSGIYGIENASKTIFNVSAKNVNLEQAAVLAGIVKNPKKYSPLNNLKESESRRNIVLKVMADNGAITAQRYESAKATPLIVSYKQQKTNYCMQYYQNAIDEASELLGISDKELIFGNYSIHTYMDEKLQRATYAKIDSQAYNPYECNQLSITVDNFNYGISAYHSNTSQPLRLINRQYGSLLKPFSVYGAAFENNYYPAYKIMDEPINYDGYSPQNYDKSYHGMVTLRESLVKSYNVTAVKMLNQIGLSSSLKILGDLGFTASQAQQNLSIALGSLSGSPLTMVGAYAMLANGGVYSAPRFISEIYDIDGVLVYSDNHQKISQVLSPDSAYMINDILSDCAKVGTASKMQYVPYSVAAKTGTVGDKVGNITDVWSCGYSTEYTVLSWQGQKDKELPTNYGGGGMPTLIVKDIMMDMSAADDFICPDTINKLPINKQLLDESDMVVYDPTSQYYELFTSLNMPEQNVEPILQEDGENIYINGGVGSRLTIYKIGIFGGEKLIFDGVITSEQTILNDYFYDSFLLNRYKVIIGGNEFLFQY